MSSRIFYFLFILNLVFYCTYSTSSISSSATVDIDAGREFINPSRKSNRWRRQTTTESISTNEIPSQQETQDYVIPTLTKPSSDHITKFIAECDMPTIFGTFRMRSYTYTSKTQTLEPIVIISGNTI